MTSIRQSMSIPCAGGILPYRFWSSDKLTGSQTAGNVKFIRKNDRRSEPIMETMTDGRVYAFVGGGEIKSVVYFDGDNKRVKQIDVDAPHRPYFAGPTHITGIITMKETLRRAHLIRRPRRGSRKRMGV